MRTLILADNLLTRQLAEDLQSRHGEIDIYQSPGEDDFGLPRLSVTDDLDLIRREYSLVIALHCLQIFPSELISHVRCINVHPGYNPFNRGWYPNVFSIINGMQVGVTIHEIDEQIDHGPIIVQREYPLKSWDTAESVYDAIMKLERKLILEWFERIRDGDYTTSLPSHDGNLNRKQDYLALKQLDLDRVGSFREFLNHLRALSHGSHRNASFTAPDGTRVFVRVELEPENSE